MARLAQADLERALGGAHVLVELLDLDGDGTADATMISEILTEVDAEANSYINLAVDIGDSTVDTAPLLLMREKACAKYLCWIRGTRAQAIPAAVVQERTDAIQWYQDVGARKAGLGLTTRPTASQPVQQVTLAATDDYFRTAQTSVGPAGPRGRYPGWS